MTYRELIRVVRERGCEPLRTRGSHQVWTTPKGRRFGLVVNHLHAEVSRCVLRSARIALAAEGLDLPGKGWRCGR